MADTMGTTQFLSVVDPQATSKQDYQGSQHTSSWTELSECGDFVTLSGRERGKYYFTNWKLFLKFIVYPLIQ